MLRRLIFEIPQSRDDRIGAGLDKGVHHTRNIRLSDRTDSGVASRKRDELCPNMQFANLPRLQQPIVRAVYFWGKYQRRPIWVFNVCIAMKREMEDFAALC